MDCTKLVEFLKSFVKLLVLNDSKPDFGDDTDAVVVVVAFEFAVGAESGLFRMDFCLWLNIVLAFSHI